MLTSGCGLCAIFLSKVAKLCKVVAAAAWTTEEFVRQDKGEEGGEGHGKLVACVGFKILRKSFLVLQPFPSTLDEKKRGK